MSDNDCTLKTYHTLFLKVFINELPKLLVVLADIINERIVTDRVLIKGVVNKIKNLSGFCGAGPVHYSCFQILKQVQPKYIIERCQTMLENVWDLQKKISENQEDYGPYEIKNFEIELARDF